MPWRCYKERISIRNSCAKKMSVSLRSLEKCKGGNGVMENQLKELLLYQMVRLLFQKTNMAF